MQRLAASLVSVCSDLRLGLAPSVCGVDQHRGWGLKVTDSPHTDRAGGDQRRATGEGPACTSRLDTLWLGGDGAGCTALLARLRGPGRAQRLQRCGWS